MGIHILLLLNRFIADFLAKAERQDRFLITDTYIQFLE